MQFLLPLWFIRSGNSFLTMETNTWKRNIWRWKWKKQFFQIPSQHHVVYRHDTFIIFVIFTNPLPTNHPSEWHVCCRQMNLELSKSLGAWNGPSKTSSIERSVDVAVAVCVQFINISNWEYSHMVIMTNNLIHGLILLHPAYLPTGTQHCGINRHPSPHS